MVVEERSSDKSKKKNTGSPVYNHQSSDDDSDPTILLSERIQNLRQAIEEIDTALAERKVLSERFLEQIEEEKKEVKHHLAFLNDPWKTGFFPELEFLRLSFHKSITSRAKDSRAEELKYWQDTIKLIMDRRKLVDEYKELLAAKKRLMQ
jgi:hypothetical protein